MSCKKKAPTIVKDGEVQWNDDDFNLDSETGREVFTGRATAGFPPAD
jgi:hypothetical protein